MPLPLPSAPLPRRHRIAARRPARRLTPDWLITLPVGSQQVFMGLAAWNASNKK